MHLKRKIIHQGGRNTDASSGIVRDSKRGENKGNERGGDRAVCFRFLFQRGTMHLYRWRCWGGYRSPDIGGPYLNAAETAPNQTLFRPIDFAAVTDRGGKKSPITLRLIGVNSARNSRWNSYFRAITLSYNNRVISIGKQIEPPRFVTHTHMCIYIYIHT